MQKMLFNDAVLNRMEFYTNEVVETAIPFGGMYPNNFECEYMARWRYEKDCLDRFNHLLGLMDKNELSDFELYNLQALCFNILDVSIQKGFFDGAEELLKRIGLGLIEREDVQIEGKEYLVKERLEHLMEYYAKAVVYSGVGKFNSNNSTQFLGYGGGLTSRAKTLLKQVYNGRYGKLFKGDIELAKILATDFNEHFIMINGKWLQVQSLANSRLYDVENIVGSQSESRLLFEGWEY